MAQNGYGRAVKNAAISALRSAARSAVAVTGVTPLRIPAGLTPATAAAMPRNSLSVNTVTSSLIVCCSWVADSGAVRRISSAVTTTMLLHFDQGNVTLP
jgi:hypothetical protein